MDFLIEKTSSDTGWDWLTGEPSPSDLPAVLIDFIRAYPSGEPFRIGHYDAEDARVWAMKTWGEAPAPITVRVAGLR